MPGAVLATTARELDRRTIARMRGAKQNEKIVLPNVILSDTETATIELEEFSVYAPDATILVYDSATPRKIAPPARRYFKGKVANDPTATVFFSVSTNSSAVDGLIVIGQKKFAIARGRRLPNQRSRTIETEAPVLVAETDAFTSGVERPPFQCGTENHTLSAGEMASRLKPAATFIATDTAFELRIAIETDNELYAGFGAPGAGTDNLVNTYIGDLVAQASVIYMRDLNTKLNLGHVNIRPTNVPDAFSKTEAREAHGEFGTYWHNNHSGVPRSAAVMVSGKHLETFGGVAWTDRICRGDFKCSVEFGCFGDVSYADQWGGAYAINGITDGVDVVVPNPNTTTVDGIEYGQPADNSWMLQGFSHELGHVVGSMHTHCVGLNDEEKTLYNVTRDFVDDCSPFGCASRPFSIPAEKGTIMSYCYLQSRTVGGVSYPESRYLFGKAGEPSEKMLVILRDGLENGVPTGDITIGAGFPCGAPGQPASVYDCGTGCTYAWSISGGSIQGSTTGQSISFTASSFLVTVTASVADEKGCTIRTSATTNSQCANTLAAPANVVATAASSTAVNLSWTAVAGATGYEVGRIADALSSYVTVGTPAGNAFTDSAAAANVSYLYRVAARDGAATGPYGTPDLATTVIFTGDPLMAQSTLIAALHLTQLRTAVNATRVLAGIGAIAFSDANETLVAVRKVHVDELRTNLDTSRAALGLTALTYAEAITAMSTTIKASHFTELRNGVK